MTVVDTVTNERVARNPPGHRRGVHRTAPHVRRRLSLLRRRAADAGTYRQAESPESRAAPPEYRATRLRCGCSARRCRRPYPDGRSLPGGPACRRPLSLNAFVFPMDAVLQEGPRPWLPIPPASRRRRARRPARCRARRPTVSPAWAPGRPLIMYYGGDLVEVALAAVLAIPGDGPQDDAMRASAGVADSARRLTAGQRHSGSITLAYPRCAGLAGISCE